MKLKFFILFLVMALVSCGHLVEDPHVNPAEYGHYRMEFDINDTTSLRKEVGIGNIYLKEDQSLEGLFFKIYGIGTGTMYLKSDACGINLAKTFNMKTVFYLKDLINTPTKCSIEIVAESDKIDNREHRIVETGVVKLNVLPKNFESLVMGYNRANDFGVRQEYSYIAQGSMQRQEGDLTRNEFINFFTQVDGGGQYRISGCGLELTGTYTKNSFVLKFYDIYKKNYLKREDSCDFEILAIPNKSLFSKMARFSLVIYSKEVVKLEPMGYVVKGNNLTAKGAEYIVGCAINDTFKADNTCTVKYAKDMVYWIRGITLNARKSIYAVKNNEVFWAE